MPREPIFPKNGMGSAIDDTANNGDGGPLFCTEETKPPKTENPVIKMTEHEPPAEKIPGVDTD